MRTSFHHQPEAQHPRAVSAGFESGGSLSSLGERVYRIDSPVGATRMPKSLSGDLRERVIEAVEEGASRREAAERF